jgi:hypothetical protein
LNVFNVVNGCGSDEVGGEDGNGVFLRLLLLCFVETVGVAGTAVAVVVAVVGTVVIVMVEDVVLIMT